MAIRTRLPPKPRAPSKRTTIIPLIILALTNPKLYLSCLFWLSLYIAFPETCMEYLPYMPLLWFIAICAFVPFAVIESMDQDSARLFVDDLVTKYKKQMPYAKCIATRCWIDVTNMASWCLALPFVALYVAPRLLYNTMLVLIRTVQGIYTKITTLTLQIYQIWKEIQNFLQATRSPVCDIAITALKTIRHLLVRATDEPGCVARNAATTFSGRLSTVISCTVNVFADAIRPAFSSAKSALALGPELVTWLCIFGSHLVTGSLIMAVLLPVLFSFIISPVLSTVLALALLLVVVVFRTTARQPHVTKSPGLARDHVQ